MRGSALIVDDDLDVSRIVADVLVGEGFAIAELGRTEPAAIQAGVARLEPDVVLLDGRGERVTVSPGSMRHGCVSGAVQSPVIMFTAHSRELVEAQVGASERSKKAAFVGFLPKPFDRGYWRRSWSASSGIPPDFSAAGNLLRRLRDIGE